MCHHNTFLIHASLENPTKERWNFVTHVSVVFCMGFMLVFGLIGYVTFTGNVQGETITPQLLCFSFLSVFEYLVWLELSFQAFSIASTFMVLEYI